MKTTLIGVGVAASIALAAGAASADVLDFTEVSAGFQGSDTITLSNALITSGGDDSFVYGAFFDADVGAHGGFCGIDSGSCEADATVDFTMGPISDLTFDALYHDAGDSASLTIFAGLTALATISISDNTFVDFTGFSGITSLFIDDSSSGAGYGYANFAFTQDDSTPPVPLPAGLPLLVVGLGAFGLLRRRK